MNKKIIKGCGDYPTIIELLIFSKKKKGWII